jgi:hypothetical protein
LTSSSQKPESLAAEEVETLAEEEVGLDLTFFRGGCPSLPVVAEVSAAFGCE